MFLVFMSCLAYAIMSVALKHIATVHFRRNALTVQCQLLRKASLMSYMCDIHDHKLI